MMTAKRRSAARVESINVGLVREIVAGPQLVTSAMFKTPVGGRVRARGSSLEGDHQADRRRHGGPDQSVYAYAREDLQHWTAVLGRRMDDGGMGENVTTTGLDLSEAVIGERWRIGSAVLEVTGPRVPCYKLGLRMGDPTFVRTFAKSRRPGTYLRIVDAGDLMAGDTIEVVDRPDHGITIGTVVDICYGEPARAGELLAAPQLAERWSAWVRQFA